MTLERLAVISKAYKESWYSVICFGGHEDRWRAHYAELLARNGVGKPKEWFCFSGAELNEAFSLKGSGRFYSELMILAFPVEGLNFDQLAMLRMLEHDDWFHDLINDASEFSEGDDKRADPAG